MDEFITEKRKSKWGRGSNQKLIVIFNRFHGKLTALQIAKIVEIKEGNCHF